MSLFTRKAEEIGSTLYRKLIFPFKRIGMEVATKSILKDGTYIKATRLDGRNYIGKNTLVSGSTIGFGSYVSNDSLIRNTSIGRYTSIGPQFLCAFGAHPTKDFVAMHPAFYCSDPHQGFTYADRTSFAEQKYVDEKNGIQLNIGSDVWIGARVTICDGVTIGDGAVIAAGAVVVKDVEPYAIYGGVPAKKIGQRFKDDEIDKLMSTKWWEQDENNLREKIALFSDISNVDKL